MEQKEQRYINTVTGSEFIPGASNDGDVIPGSIIAVGSDNPFFAGYDESQYKLVFEFGKPPYLIEIVQCEGEEVAPLVDPALEAKRYLDETDWYIVRQIETGKYMPEDVAQKRAEARKLAGVSQ